MVKKAQEITAAGAQDPDGEKMIDLVAITRHMGYGYGGADGKYGPVNVGDKITVNEYRAARVLAKGLAVLPADYPPKEADPLEAQENLLDQQNAQTNEVPNTPARVAKAKAKAKVSAKIKSRHK